MNQIFIDKLKNAIQTTDPVESVKELISEFEELHRLALWREKIITSGRGYKTHKKELDRVQELLEENGYYENITDDKIDTEMRKFFRKIK